MLTSGSSEKIATMSHQKKKVPTYPTVHAHKHQNSTSIIHITAAMTMYVWDVVVVVS